MLQEKLMSAPLPVLETVSAFVRLIPCFTLPKLMLAGVRLTVGEFTVSETPADVLPLQLLSPAYLAVSVLAPVLKKGIEQVPVPEVRVPVQDSPVLAVTISAPAGLAPDPA